MNLFKGLNKFKKSSILLEDENSNFSILKEAHQKSKFKLDAKKSLLILGLFLAFISNPLKAQTFFFTPGWGSAPCDVSFDVYEVGGGLPILSGNKNTITTPPSIPIGNCFFGIPAYVIYTINGVPYTVTINSTLTLSLPCLGGASYTFTAYYNSPGMGCPQETLILNY